jgi:hypothetical protein
MLIGITAHVGEMMVGADLDEDVTARINGSATLP